MTALFPSQRVLLPRLSTATVDSILTIWREQRGFVKVLCTLLYESSDEPIHTVVRLEYRRRPVPLRAKAEFRPRPDDLCWPSPASRAAASGAAPSRSTRYRRMRPSIR